LAVAKGVYQASKHVGATHWIVATERSLQRLLARNGFPFVQLGPEFDYFGPVAPYSMNLAEFERVILSGRYPALADFTLGVEPLVDAGAASIGTQTQFVHHLRATARVLPATCDQSVA
jgi:hypothetical protein